MRDQSPDPQDMYRIEMNISRKYLLNRKRIDVIFINSEGHSGSTILDVLFSARKNVMGLGEVEKFGHKASVDYVHCACGATVAECDFWKEFVGSHREYIQKKVRHLRMKSRYFFSSRQHYSVETVSDFTCSLAEYEKNNQELFRYALTKSTSELLVDSSKNIVMLSLYKYGPIPVFPPYPALSVEQIRSVPL